MTIKKETQKTWATLCAEWGMIKKLENETGLSRPTIIAAVHSGNMSVKTYEKLNDFFNKNTNLINETT